MPETMGPLTALLGITAAPMHHFRFKFFGNGHLDY
jgi:hypothetical protein